MEFTAGDVKHIKIGDLTTIKNITLYMLNLKKKKKKKKIRHRYISKNLFIDTEQFSKMQNFGRYFPKILLIDLELPTLKMYFFEVVLFFKNFVDRLQNSYQSYICVVLVCNMMA